MVAVREALLAGAGVAAATLTGAGATATIEAGAVEEAGGATLAGARPAAFANPPFVLKRSTSVAETAALLTTGALGAAEAWALARVGTMAKARPAKKARVFSFRVFIFEVPFLQDRAENGAGAYCVAGVTPPAGLGRLRNSVTTIKRILGSSMNPFDLLAVVEANREGALLGLLHGLGVGGEVLLGRLDAGADRLTLVGVPRVGVAQQGVGAVRELHVGLGRLRRLVAVVDLGLGLVLGRLEARADRLGLVGVPRVGVAEQGVGAVRELHVGLGRGRSRFGDGGGGLAGNDGGRGAGELDDDRPRVGELIALRHGPEVPGTQADDHDGHTHGDAAPGDGLAHDAPVARVEGLEGLAPARGRRVLGREAVGFGLFPGGRFIDDPLSGLVGRPVGVVAIGLGGDALALELGDLRPALGGHVDDRRVERREHVLGHGGVLPHRTEDSLDGVDVRRRVERLNHGQHLEHVLGGDALTLEVCHEGIRIHLLLLLFAAGCLGRPRHAAPCPGTRAAATAVPDGMVEETTLL